jgi:hypothetical protein
MGFFSFKCNKILPPLGIKEVSNMTYDNNDGLQTTTNMTAAKKSMWVTKCRKKMKNTPWTNRLLAQ